MKIISTWQFSTHRSGKKIEIFWKMILKTFRMNEQPVSKILFKGDWGRCPNKQFAENDRKGIL